MIEFDTTVRIDRPCEQVFSILADFEANLARWAKGPVAAGRTAGDGGTGSRYTVTARVGPAKIRSPYEVTGYDPPARFAGHGTAGPVHFREEYRLTADGTATILTQSIRATPRGPFRLAEGPLRRQLQQLIASDLGRLKTLAEAQLRQNQRSTHSPKAQSVHVPPCHALTWKPAAAVMARPFRELPCPARLGYFKTAFRA